MYVEVLKETGKRTGPAIILGRQATSGKMAVQPTREGGAKSQNIFVVSGNGFIKRNQEMDENV